MIRNTHKNLAKQTNFLFQRTKMIQDTQISVVNCKIMNEHMNQQTEFIHCRFIMNEPVTPPKHTIHWMPIMTHLWMNLTPS
jgi:hypothetical protein